MPGISRALIDTAGGLIQTTPQVIATLEGFPIAVVGATVADHGSGVHNAASFVVGSLLMSVNGLPVVFATTPATCGDVATGSLVAVVAI